MKIEEAINEVKEIMKKQGYIEVTKILFHKNKKKVKEHGCWRIGNKYYYFLKK